jgi:hypothetical protein
MHLLELKPSLFPMTAEVGNSMQESDLITQIQEELSALCSMLFNFTGAVQVICYRYWWCVHGTPKVSSLSKTKRLRPGCSLQMQRDAPPVSVRGEAVEPGAASQDTISQIQPMAEQIVGASKQLDQLIKHLPDIPDTEEEQLSRIAAVLAENEAVGSELREVQRQAANQLSRVQALFGVLADAELRKRSSQAASDGRG